MQGVRRGRIGEVSVADLATLRESLILCGAVEFEWHDDKSDRNLRQRGFGFDHASRIFAGHVLVLEDQQRGGELRHKAVGAVAGHVLVVVFTMRGEVYRIISARTANRREALKWRSSAENSPIS